MLMLFDDSGITNKAPAGPIFSWVRDVLRWSQSRGKPLVETKVGRNEAQLSPEPASSFHSHRPLAMTQAPTGRACPLIYLL